MRSDVGCLTEVHGGPARCSLTSGRCRTGPLPRRSAARDTNHTASRGGFSGPTTRDRRVSDVLSNPDTRKALQTLAITASSGRKQTRCAKRRTRWIRTQLVLLVAPVVLVVCPETNEISPENTVPAPQNGSRTPKTSREPRSRGAVQETRRPGTALQYERSDAVPGRCPGALQRALQT